MALALYRGVTTAAAPIIRHYVHARVRKGKEDATRIGERFGATAVARPDGPLVWIHAASVGESLSMLCVIERLMTERPSVKVMVTTGTVSSARILKDRLPAAVIHQFVPVDNVAWVRRFLDHWRPDLALWVESEFWPNLLIETNRRDVPLILMNARMSEKSYRGWKRLSGVIHNLLGLFSLCMAQSEDHAKMLDALGARNVLCPGNLKLAAAPLPADEAALATLSARLDGRPVWLAASTHPGEEELVAAAHDTLAGRHPGLLTIIVPRHSGRGPSIAETLRAAGGRVALRSVGDEITGDTGIYIADSMGELGLFYRLAKIVFVGGTLVPHGGQNPLEPARLGCAVLYGPHMENFGRIADEMNQADAGVTVSDAPDIARQVHSLLQDPALFRARATAATAVAAQKSEILDTVFAALAPYLDALAAEPVPAPRHARA